MQEEKLLDLLASYLGIYHFPFEILKDMETLIAYWRWRNRPPDDEETNLYGTRQLEVLKETIPKITTLPRLLYYLEFAPLPLETGEIIKNRTIELINSVSSKDIPEWFARALRGEFEIPDFLKELFQKKVEELYAQLPKTAG